jgi:hypothetical protein
MMHDDGERDEREREKLKREGNQIKSRGGSIAQQENQHTGRATLLAAMAYGFCSRNAMSTQERCFISEAGSKCSGLVSQKKSKNIEDLYFVRRWGTASSVSIARSV